MNVLVVEDNPSRVDAIVNASPDSVNIHLAKDTDSAIGNLQCVALWDVIFLDFDLCMKGTLPIDQVGTGADVAEYIAQIYHRAQRLPKIVIQSCNPLGSNAILQILSKTACRIQIAANIHFYPREITKAILYDSLAYNVAPLWTEQFGWLSNHIEQWKEHTVPHIKDKWWFNERKLP